MGKDDGVTKEMLEDWQRSLADYGHGGWTPSKEAFAELIQLGLSALAAGKQEPCATVESVANGKKGDALFAHPPAGLPERQADCIMRCHDALIAGDSKEAYHWLYQLQDAIPGGDPYKPFEHIKSAAPTQEAKS